MTCQECGQDFAGPACACGWRAAASSKSSGQTLRLNRCDVSGCDRVVGAGDPAKNLVQGLRLPIRCRFHRDPRYVDPPTPVSMPRLSDPGPFVPFTEIREEFDRIRAASGRALRAYWEEQDITVRPPSALPSGWSSLRIGLRQWADKWFPPIP